MESRKKKKLVPVGADKDSKSRSSRPKPPRRDDSNSKPSFKTDSYTMNKRLPFRGTKKRNDVYVTRKSNFAGQLDKCQKLLDAGESEVYVHGLGAAVNRAVHLALQLKQKYYGSLEVDVETGTEMLIDDFTPEVDDVEPVERTRLNSAIHIRVFRPVDPVGVN